VAPSAFVVGPHDPTGRFTYWAHRAAAGGEMLVPASFCDALQFVDARDLAAFTLRALAEVQSGPFNVTGPVPPVTIADVAAAAGAGATPVPVEDAFLTEKGVGFRELPLWFDEPDTRALMRTDVSRALGAGLSFRPLAETVRATVEQAEPVEGVGLRGAREAELLAAWRDR
jgi:2'-hydroxyisoflavone reductase